MPPPSPSDLVRVPVDGRVGNVNLADRRTETQWTVTVAPFELGPVPVTRGFLEQTLAVKTEPSARDLALTDVSWLDATALCNALSEQAGLSPVYEFTDLPVRPQAGRLPDTGAVRAPGSTTWGSGSPGPCPDCRARAPQRGS